MAFENITAVIPVREGYGDVADHSLLSFGEVTLLEWKIVQLKRVLPAKRIFLSTNSKKAVELAEPYGISIAKRSDADCKDNLPFATTVRGVLKNVDGKDVAICPCTAPFLGPKIFEGAFSAYNEALTRGKKSLVAVNELREYLWDCEKPVNYSCGPKIERQSKLPMWYRVTNGLFIMEKKRMEEIGYFLDDKPCLYAIDQLAGMDINYFDDYALTRELLSFYISRNTAQKPGFATCAKK